jgi:hypothetical protein
MKILLTLFVLFFSFLVFAIDVNANKNECPCDNKNYIKNSKEYIACELDNVNLCLESYGTYTFANGKYVGELKGGNFNGQGTYTFNSGAKYVGEWKEDKQHGQGTWTYADGDKYVGEFKDGKKHEGTYTYVSGSSYVGEFKDGDYNGQGTLTYANWKYVGEFKDGDYNGQGTITSAVGNKYVGEFKDGYFHGQGTWTYADGGKYVGEFKYSKFNGQGIEIFANGDKYEGEFQDDKRNGQGTFTFSAGGSYVGEWKEGKRHGHGTNIYAEYEGLSIGDEYVGEFKDGKRHGFGTFTYINGDKKIGEWKNDKFVKSNFGYKNFMFGMPKKYVIDLDVCEGVFDEWKSKQDENAICYEKKNWRFNFSYTLENKLQSIVIDLGVYEEDSWEGIKNKIEKKYDIDFTLCKKLFFSCTPKQLELFLDLKIDYFAYSFHEGHVLLELVRNEDDIERMQVGYYNDELAKQNLENYKFVDEVSSDDF